MYPSIPTSERIFALACNNVAMVVESDLLGVLDFIPLWCYNVPLWCYSISLDSGAIWVAHLAGEMLCLMDKVN